MRALPHRGDGLWRRGCAAGVAVCLPADAARPAHAGRTRLRRDPARVGPQRLLPDRPAGGAHRAPGRAGPVAHGRERAAALVVRLAVRGPCPGRDAVGRARRCPARAAAAKDQTGRGRQRARSSCRSASTCRRCRSRRCISRRRLPAWTRAGRCTAMACCPPTCTKAACALPATAPTDRRASSRSIPASISRNAPSTARSRSRRGRAA